MSAQHTPGPWWLYADRIETRSGLVLIERSAIHGEDANEIAANARLIAAALDLLRVAELLVHWLDEEPGAHKLCDTARAAIAKATGEQA